MVKTAGEGWVYLVASVVIESQLPLVNFDGFPDLPWGSSLRSTLIGIVHIVFVASAVVRSVMADVNASHQCVGQM